MAERGRPTLYTEEKAQYICDKISQGITLSDICREDAMPQLRTVYDWMEAHPTFSANITRAREAGYDVIADECIRIADFTQKDTVDTEYGPKPDMEWIQRSKLRVETRLKLLAKWNPKKYGDKLDITSKDEALVSPLLQIEIVPPKPLD